MLRQRRWWVTPAGRQQAITFVTVGEQTVAYLHHRGATVLRQRLQALAEHAGLDLVL